MNIIQHLSERTILSLNVWGIDISITNEIIVLWVAFLLICLFFYFSGKNANIIPHKLQNISEMYISSLWYYIEPIIKDKTWLPFFCALFSFILFCNLLGILPGVVPPTANINFTATLAVIVFLLSNVVGIKKHGMKQYFSSFIPSGIPKFMVPIFLPIEVLSILTRPLSLSIRLFANIFAGHAVTLTLISLIFVFKSYWVVPGSVFGNTIISLFEIFIALIQAFIFTFLSAFYIGSSIKLEH